MNKLHVAKDSIDKGSTFFHASPSYLLQLTFSLHENHAASEELELQHFQLAATSPGLILSP